MTNITKQRHVSDKKIQEIGQKFSDLGISESILAILKRLNLDIPTPIQHKTIPIALDGQDLIGVAQTGTGKTFAFGIPMLQRLGISKKQGLVIAPTRELALQVEESIKKLGQPLGLRTAILIGGEALDRQLFQLRKKPHIVVATPGRLIDHLKRRTYKLDQVNILVLDEADMMLDLGFAPQIKEILDQAPKDRQTMLFSATMPVAIVKIAANYMKLPVSIEVAPPGSTVAEIDQEIFIIKGEDRFDHLLKVLDTYKGSVLVFVRTKHGVKALTQKLQSLGQRAVEIHSNLSLNRRRAALGDFKSKKERILVATDVAARGLDVQGIELVVNYNLPDSTGDYVHRIGRTGRAGQVGKAITFATSSEQREIWAIEKLINKNIKRTEFVKFARPSGPVAPTANRPRVVTGSNAGRSEGRRFASNRQFGSKQQFGASRGLKTGGARTGETRTNGVRTESKPFRSNYGHSATGVQKSTSNRYGRPSQGLTPFRERSSRPSARPFSRRGQFNVK